MPPSARSNQPFRSPTAPVKLPFSWPNSSESTSSAGMAPQFTRMKGPVFRRDRLWMVRATTSLPEPVSPRIRTGASAGATSSMCSMTSFKPVSAPTTESAMSCRSSRESSERLSASTASRSEISSRTRRSFSSAIVNGSIRSRARASCRSSKVADGRATRIKAPISPSSATRGATRQSPVRVSGSSRGRCLRSSASGPSIKFPWRHHSTIRASSRGVQSVLAPRELAPGRTGPRQRYPGVLARHRPGGPAAHRREVVPPGTASPA